MDFDGESHWAKKSTRVGSGSIWTNLKKIMLDTGFSMMHAEASAKWGAISSFD